MMPGTYSRSSARRPAPCTHSGLLHQRRRRRQYKGSWLGGCNGSSGSRSSSSQVRWRGEARLQEGLLPACSCWRWSDCITTLQKLYLVDDNVTTEASSPIFLVCNFRNVGRQFHFTSPQPPSLINLQTKY